MLSWYQGQAVVLFWRMGPITWHLKAIYSVSFYVPYDFNNVFENCSLSLFLLSRLYILDIWCIINYIWHVHTHNTCHKHKPTAYFKRRMQWPQRTLALYVTYFGPRANNLYFGQHVPNLYLGPRAPNLYF